MKPSGSSRQICDVGKKRIIRHHILHVEHNYAEALIILSDLQIRRPQPQKPLQQQNAQEQEALRGKERLNRRMRLSDARLRPLAVGCDWMQCVRCGQFCDGTILTMIPRMAVPSNEMPCRCCLAPPLPFPFPSPADVSSSSSSSST